MSDRDPLAEQTLGMVLRSRLQAGESPSTLATEFRLRPSDVFRIMAEDPNLLVEPGHEQPTDTHDRHMQLLVEASINVYADVLLDPFADVKARLHAADKVLDRRSYSGVKRVLNNTRLTLSEETVAILTRTAAILDARVGQAPAAARVVNQTPALQLVKKEVA